MEAALVFGYLLLGVMFSELFELRVRAMRRCGSKHEIVRKYTAITYFKNLFTWPLIILCYLISKLRQLLGRK